MVDKGKFEPPDPSKLGAAPGAEETSTAYEDAEPHNDLMSIAGVVMVGEGLDDAGRPAFIVGVRSEGDLPRVPASCAGRAVLKHVIGEVFAQPLARPRDYD
jgi:hypothetical protein